NILSALTEAFKRLFRHSGGGTKMNLVIVNDVVNSVRTYLDSWVMVLDFVQGLKSNADFGWLRNEPYYPPSVAQLGDYAKLKCKRGMSGPSQQYSAEEISSNTPTKGLPKVGSGRMVRLADSHHGYKNVA
ncbi:MAG: hypothetical protein ACU843_18190, partial [Gammaproteobacteria bacterium]